MTNRMTARRTSRSTYAGTSLVAAVLLAGALAGCGGGGSDHGSKGAGHHHGKDKETAGAASSVPRPPSPSSTATESADPTGTAVPPVSSARVDCPAATVTVGDAASLKSALARAAPGTSIKLADGTYDGRFTAKTPGTADRPVFLCGGPGAVLDAGGIKGGYGFHLDGASYWRLVGFTVTNGQKGVVADKVRGSVIQGLTVRHIGDEAIHLRDFSSDNVVRDNTISDTGRRRDKFGEGVYIGSAKSNWCTNSDCEPDASDRNAVIGNRISATTAEAVDIKEGTTGGVLSGNTFDGARLSGSNNDSWVDVKGNGWLIENNTGTHSTEDGFQTHEILKGWGTGNTFKGNVARVDGPGWGFHLTSDGNTVACDNKVSDAAKGLANVACAS
ncbi:Right handed beta helix region [Actinacidiphila alni]|uniref:Right handed beta helix region n=1 Tax=Actinacidiphila alni TaxID=380248 RepID=A0A1I2IRU1_9ACTN|nr:right-handed parallel beta-helix repeat-containing protein [Actinacidiphila alni]SFF45122.1 Right handed beta helix region [Actinacidiphila alni]